MLALLVLVAFYAFTVGTIALLLMVTWLQVKLMTQTRGGPVIPVLLIIPPLGALAMFLAIMPRGPRLGYPGRDCEGVKAHS